MLKRSIINRSIEDAIEFFKTMNYPIPDFAYWEANDWKNKGSEYDEIRETRIGWDVTDFGSGDFYSVGRTIFTLRNGRAGMENKYPKTYAQKIMYMLENQKSPVHMHLSKMEDIINNGGGNIEIKVWKADSYNKLSPEGFDVSIDGKSLSVPAGAKIKLTPGQSIAIPPKTFHQFWAEPGKGPVLSMEVSSVCNDLSDNYWLENGERFPDLDEDAPARFVLCNEY